MGYDEYFRSVLIKIRLIVASLLLCSALIGPTAALETDVNNLEWKGNAIAGVALGMDLESVLKIYPTATIERTVANCYNYGQAIRVPALTRRTLRDRYKAGKLTLSFEPPNSGGRLSRIHIDHPVDPSTVGIRKLISSLSAQYGPYDKILYRRKMEPAGRIVGFEWHYVDGSLMRAVLRNDFDNGRDGIRLSILARSNVLTPRPNRRALSLLCGKP